MYALCTVFSYRLTFGGSRCVAVLRQLAELKVGLAEANGKRKEEAVGATSKLRAVVERAEELKVELATAREGAAEKERQLVEHRDEVCACVPCS